MILPRFQLIGEGVIAEEEFPQLSDGRSSLWLFLEEPDTDRWPQEMSHLKRYVTDSKML